MLLRHCCLPGGGGDNDNDNARWEEQDMPYANVDALSHDRQWAEGEEDNSNNGGDKIPINRHVQGPHQPATGNGGLRRLQCDDDINKDKEESVLHPTLRTTAMRKLAEMLSSASRNRQQAEAEEDNVNDGGNNEHINGRVRGPRLADTRDGRRRRLQCNGANNDNVKEGRLHPTPQTTVTQELAARLHSAGILYALEASLSNMDNANGQRQQ